MEKFGLRFLEFCVPSEQHADTSTMWGLFDGSRSSGALLNPVELARKKHGSVRRREDFVREFCVVAAIDRLICHAIVSFQPRLTPAPRYASRRA
jgi:hypothetical protein